MTIKVCDTKLDSLRIATKKEVRAIRNHLLDLAYGSVKPKYKTEGICTELFHVFKVRHFTVSINPYIATWSKLDRGAGCNQCYPIKDKKGNFWVSNMWDRRTRVGKLRHELAAHIAEELSKELTAGVYTDD